jgi:DNA polymerase delta subunit 1
MATVLIIEDLGLVDDWVYDLETNDGTFSTGDGIILKNTDSCYIKFDVDKKEFPDDDTHSYMKEHFRLAEECSKAITETFKPPIELEFEKVMSPFFLFAKKRYAYLEWTNPNKHNNVEYKGIQVVRRDNCQYVKDVSTDILNKLMYDQDIESAKEIAINGVNNLLHNKVPIEKLVVSKSLNKYYKKDGVEVDWSTAEVSYPHVRLAQNLIKLDPMGHPKPPDRVPFIYIKTKDKKALQWERVAHPSYMGDNKLDPLYYLEKQLISPLETLFELLIDDTSVLYAEERQKCINKNEGYVKTIDNFFEVTKSSKPITTVKKPTKPKITSKQSNMGSFFAKKT